VAERNFMAELLEIINSPKSFTDIRLSQDEPISVRMPKGWVQLDDCFITPSANDIGSVMESIQPSWDEIVKVRAINKPVNLGAWRLRINCYLADGGKKLMMVIRRIPSRPPTLKEVGLPPSVRLMLQAQRGLILIVGATRSGKSTTAAAMLDELNRTRFAHIITIEDPVEYQHLPEKSIFSPREVGVDVDSYEEGLEDAMRQCPDVIMVGEIRNRDTAETALFAGESGHLVIGTMHANSAAHATQRLLGWFNDNERASKVMSLSGCLVGIVSQILLPHKTGEGYVLATELMNNVDQSYSKHIGNMAALNSALESPERNGSVSLAESLASLVNSSAIAATEAMQAVATQPAVKEKLKAQIKV